MMGGAQSDISWTVFVEGKGDKTVMVPAVLSHPVA